MQKQQYDQLQETVYSEVMPNGLRVYVLPKQGFSKTFATFTTDYGSIDNAFVPIGQKQSVEVPDGIAHFLEHKMFEDEEGDVFDTFGKQGASANAFTSFTRTAYLFSSTDDTAVNLHTLLDFVQHPYFTEESVEKEKGIIGQEISMYDDDADWRLFFQLLGNLYHRHPARIDIAGTAESINRITKDDLYTCYHTFYHPANMILYVAGAVEPQEIFELVRNNQAEKEFTPMDHVERIEVDEPATALHSKAVEKMSIRLPKVLLGYKLSLHSETDNLLYQEARLELLLETLFGEGSEAYETLYSEGLIDDSFSSEAMIERSFSLAALGGNTPKPEETEARLLDIIEHAQTEGMDERRFERMRKKLLGQLVKQLNSTEFLATEGTRYAFHGASVMDAVEIMQQVTFDDISRLLQSEFRIDNRTTSIIDQKAEADA